MTSVVVWPGKESQAARAYIACIRAGKNPTLKLKRGVDKTRLADAIVRQMVSPGNFPWGKGWNLQIPVLFSARVAATRALSRARERAWRELLAAARRRQKEVALEHLERESEGQAALAEEGRRGEWAHRLCREPVTLQELLALEEREELAAFYKRRGLWEEAAVELSDRQETPFVGVLPPMEVNPPLELSEISLTELEDYVGRALAGGAANKSRNLRDYQLGEKLPELLELLEVDWPIGQYNNYFQQLVTPLGFLVAQGRHERKWAALAERLGSQDSTSLKLALDIQRQLQAGAGEEEAILFASRQRGVDIDTALAVYRQLYGETIPVELAPELELEFEFELKGELELALEEALLHERLTAQDALLCAHARARVETLLREWGYM